MKNLRTILVFLAVILMGQQADAQKKGTAEYKAQIAAACAAIDTIMATHGLDEPIKDFFDQVIKKYDNNVHLQVHVAEGFSRSKLQSHDIAYQRMENLIKKYPKEMEPYLTYAQLLVERSERLETKDSLALMKRGREIIDTCKTVLPDSIEPYMKWIRMFIKRDTMEVEKEAEALHQRFPQYPVYSEVARTYYANFLENTSNTAPAYLALKYIRKEDLNIMSLGTLKLYTLINSQLNDNETGLDLVTFAIGKYPDDKFFYKYLLKFNAMLGDIETEKKNPDIAKMYYTDAIAASEKYFGFKDTVKFERTDYMYTANAFKGLKRYTKAIAMYRKEMATDGIKVDAYENALRNISTCYQDIAPDSSIIVYEELLAFKEKNGKAVEAFDYYNLASKCTNYSTELIGSEKIAMLYKADSLWMMIPQIDSTYNNASLAYFQHIRLSIIIEQAELGENLWKDAVRDACLLQKNFIEAIPEEERTNVIKQRLANAYYYLSITYVYNELETDKPDNDTAWGMALDYAEKLFQMELNSGYEGTIYRSVVKNIYSQANPGKVKRRAKGICDKYKHLEGA